MDAGRPRGPVQSGGLSTVRIKNALFPVPPGDAERRSLAGQVIGEDEAADRPFFAGENGHVVVLEENGEHGLVRGVPDDADIDHERRDGGRVLEFDDDLGPVPAAPELLLPPKLGPWQLIERREVGVPRDRCDESNTGDPDEPGSISPLPSGI